jgi:chromosomal replication initiator protein
MRAWEEFVKKQEGEFGEKTVLRWLSTLKIINFDACNLFLEAEDNFQSLWFEEHIRPKLKDFANNNGSKIRVHLAIRGQKALPRTSHAKKQSGPAPFTITFEDLDPAFSFAQIVSCPQNFLAVKLLENLSSALAKGKPFCPLPDAPNPIYLYGSPGSGKTHLLQATANALRGNCKVIFARAGLFTDHVVRAIRSAEMGQFRALYRKADVLIIDDIHELAKRSATQEEFFHTFNTLHTAGKQIILSANTSPSGLEHIEPRLVSRFEWGVSLGLAPLERKDAIMALEARARFFHFPLSEQMAEFLTSTFTSSHKAIMNALTALVFRSGLQGTYDGAIPLARVKQLLADRIEEEKNTKITPDHIISAVAEYYGIPVEDMVGKSQVRANVTPRSLAMYFCRHLLKLPFMEVGDIFCRDHSTVMSAIRSIEKQVQNPEGTMRGVIQSLEQKFYTSPS